MYQSDNKLVSYINRPWFLLLVLFLIVDLGRPQEILQVGFLKLGMITTILLTLYLMDSGLILPVVFRQNRWILYFTGLLACYIPFATNNFYAYLTFKTMMLMLPFLLSFMILVNSHAQLLAMIKVYAVLMVLMSLYSIFHGGVGPGGILGDENDVCLFFVSYMPLVLFLAGQEEKKLIKVFWLTGVVITVIAVVLTQSRGGFIGFLAMVMIYWLFSKRKAVLLLGAVVLAIIMLFVGGEIYKKDMATIIDIHENTANIRLLSWTAAWEMFLENPLGVGGNNFPVHFPEYQPPEFQRGMWGRVAHSLWFTLIPETGVLGVFIYFMIIKMNFFDLKYLRQNSSEHHKKFFKSLSIALYACFAGFFASATFLSVLYYPYFWYLSVLVASAKKVSVSCVEIVEG